MDLEVLTDDKTKKSYLVARDNYGAYLIKEIKRNATMQIHHGEITTTVFI